MKIKIEFLGLPALSAVIGKKAIIEMPPGTISDLINVILEKDAPKLRPALLDSKGALDLTVQVMVNEEGFVARDKFSAYRLKDGDLVRFMLLVGGG